MSSEGARYAGRFFFAHLPYHASCGYLMDNIVIDHKLNPQLGLLNFCLQGSNYRKYCIKAVLSKGAKELLRKVFTRDYNNHLEPAQEGEGWRVYEFYIAVEKREGKLPKIYVQNANTGTLLGIVVFGGGYRGYHVVMLSHNIEYIVSTTAGGSLGTCEAWLAVVRPPAALVVSKAGRNYDTGRYAYMLYGGNGMVVGSGGLSEVNTYLEEMGLPALGE